MNSLLVSYSPRYHGLNNYKKSLANIIIASNSSYLYMLPSKYILMFFLALSIAFLPLLIGPKRAQKSRLFGILLLSLKNENYTPWLTIYGHLFETAFSRNRFLTLFVLVVVINEHCIRIIDVHGRICNPDSQKPAHFFTSRKEALLGNT